MSSEQAGPPDDSGQRFYTALPPRDASSIQKVLNESWPYHKPNGDGHAIGIPTRDSIDVIVRIVWEHDGQEWVTGSADRWTPTHVHVAVGDTRLLVPGVWVLARDVRRIDESAALVRRRDDAE